MDPKELPKTVTKEQMEEMESAPYGTIVLYLSDNVLTEIIDKETTYEIWVKLEEMYLTRDLSNRAYLGEKFFTYNMDSNESLTDTLSEFKKLSTEFQSLGDQIDEENETFFLLNSLSDEYREVNVALKQKGEKISTNDVVSTIKTTELEILAQKKDQNSGEGSFSKGRSKNDWKDDNNRKDKSKLKCNFCQKIGHIKKDCF